MSNNQNAVDFFATVGRKLEPLKCTSFPIRLNEDDPPLSAKEIWEEAVTDIMLIGNGDNPPDLNAWILVDTTIGGEQLEHPTIAFRKRKFSGRQDHISQIVFLAPGENIPNGYEILRNTVSGKGSGYVAPWGYIAVKRASMKPESFLLGDSIILDINCVKKSNREDIPEKYVAIDRLYGNANPYANNDLIFIQQTTFALGLCNLEYEPFLLDRIPTKNYKHIALPEDALPAFMFPHGLRLDLCDRHQYPLPSFFTFVFTDQDGKHLYVACLKFYEEVNKEDLLPAFQEIWGEGKTFDLPEEKGIFCPKLICVMSRVPFYRAMRRYLRQLYSISLSSSICPLEHFIGAVVGQLPIPVEGGRPFHLVLDAALISPSSRPMTSITFDVPSERFFPIMDLDFAGPLRSFSVDVLLCIYTLMLREAKIVFVSKSNALLTETMETLRMLLFPLQWASCFVSRLPPSLVGLLQAPGGFMIGIHLDDSIVGKKIHGPQGAEVSKRYIESMHLQYPLLKGTYIVDLVGNSIHQFNGKYVESCNNLDQITKSLPAAPKLRLRAKLLKIADHFRIGPQMDEVEEVDSAFDFQSQSMSDLPPRDWPSFPTLVVRDAFMSFMADLLGDYTAFIIPPVEDLSADTYRTFREEFMVDEYLSHADVHCRPVLELLMETQMFSVLLQSRSEGTSQSLVFFEEASRLQHHLGLNLTASSLTHNGHGGTTVVQAGTSGRHNPTGGSLQGVAELPFPLYKLLECEHRWSCLSKTMQQQTLQRAALQQQQPGASATSPVAPLGTSPHVSSAKSLQLTYLANSTLRTMGSNHGISYSQHVTQNQKLQDLLQFIHFTHLDDLKDPEAMSNTAYAVARRELDRDEDLQLHVASLGPLIVPGPTLNHRMEVPSTPRGVIDEHDLNMDDEHDSRPVYCYNKGWPTLDVNLVNAADDFIHQRIKELRQERLFMLSKVNTTVKLLIRNPSERLFSDINSSQQHQQQLQQSQYSLGMLSSATQGNAAALAPKNHVSMSMMSAVLTTMSTVITTLCLRVKNGPRPLADMLQILGMLAVIDCWGLMDHISETTWRSVLVACGAYGGDSMRRISALVFKAMQSTGLVPNALTYGQYIKAIGAKRESDGNTDDVGHSLDAFYFLEEIGFCWYSHKVQESFAVSTRENRNHEAVAAAPPTVSKRRRRENPKVVIASLLAHDTYVHDLEDTLRLKRIGGTVVMFQPKSAPGFAHPLFLPIPSTLTPHLSPRRNEGEDDATGLPEDKQLQLLAPVYDYLHKRSKKIYDLAQKLQRRHSHFSTKSRQSSFTVANARSVSGNNGGLSLHPHHAQHSTDAHPNGSSKNSVFNQVKQDLSRSPMNLISKMGGSFFHRDGPQGGAMSVTASGKTSPVPPVSTNNAMTSAKSTGALSSLLSKGSSIFNAMKSSTQTSQVSSPVPSAAVSPMRTSAFSSMIQGKGNNNNNNSAPPLTPPPPPGKATHTVDNAKLQMIASLAQEETFDEDDRTESQLDDTPLDPSGVSSSSNSSSHGHSNRQSDTQPPPTTAEPNLLIFDDENDDDHDLLRDDVKGILLNEEIAAKTPHKSSHFRDSSLPLTPLLEDHTESSATGVEGASPLLIHDEKDTASSSGLGGGPSLMDEDGDNDTNTLSNTIEECEEVDDDMEDETLTLDKVQENILRVLQTHLLTETRTCLGMVCRCDCDCGVSMMFEEIMARWCHGNSIDVHRPAHARLSVSKTSANADLGILCSHCQKSLSPTLKVQKYTYVNASGNSSSSSDGGVLSVRWDEEVSMFSPFVLQFEYEELLMKVGELAQHGVWLHRQHPAIYWNLVWYAQRFHVPTGLLFPVSSDVSSSSAVKDTLETQSPRVQERPVTVSRDYFYQSKVRMVESEEREDLQAPVVIGWLPSVVERKVLRLLQGLPGDSLDIKDMFPQCTEEEFRILSDMVVSNLDGSPDGLRTAMMHLSTCPSFHSAAAAVSSTSQNDDNDYDNHHHDTKDTATLEIVKARWMYTRLLILGVHFAQIPVYDATKAGLLRDYTKDINFDKIFLDSIKCVFSQADFQSMGISEETLMSCTTNTTANTVRAMIGILP